MTGPTWTTLTIRVAIRRFVISSSDEPFVPCIAQRQARSPLDWGLCVSGGPARWKLAAQHLELHADDLPCLFERVAEVRPLRPSCWQVVHGDADGVAWLGVDCGGGGVHGCPFSQLHGSFGNTHLLHFWHLRWRIPLLYWTRAHSCQSK